MQATLPVKALVIAALAAVLLVILMSSAATYGATAGEPSAKSKIAWTPNDGCQPSC